MAMMVTTRNGTTGKTDPTLCPNSRSSKFVPQLAVPVRYGHRQSYSFVFPAILAVCDVETSECFPQFWSAPGSSIFLYERVRQWL